MDIIQIPGLQALPEAASQLLDALGDRRVVAFFGDMGAGKTTLIKAICEQLEVTDATSSPSYGLINEYRSDEGSTVYHFDLFRIRTLEEVYDLGYEEYLYSGNYCFIEWPEKVETLLPEDTVRAYIRVDENDSRTVKLKIGD